MNADTVQLDSIPINVSDVSPKVAEFTPEIVEDKSLKG
jgi:hypothetical protein